MGEYREMDGRIRELEAENKALKSSRDNSAIAYQLLEAELRASEQREADRISEKNVLERELAEASDKFKFLENVLMHCPEDSLKIALEEISRLKREVEDTHKSYKAVESQRNYWIQQENASFKNTELKKQLEASQKEVEEWHKEALSFRNKFTESLKKIGKLESSQKGLMTVEEICKVMNEWGLNSRDNKYPNDSLAQAIHAAMNGRGGK